MTSLPAPSRLAWSAALLSWVCAVPLWFLTKYILVIAHEGGHALLAKLLFQKLRSITFSKGPGGATDPEPPVPWLFNIIIGLAGYLGPSLFGLLGAWLLTHGRPTSVLGASIIFLIIMLFAVRGFLGWLLVPGLLALIILILVKSEPPLQTLYTHMWVWFLLIGAVQRMLHFILDKQYADANTDAGHLRGWTLIPGEIWAFVFLAGTISALVYGGAMLLRIAA